MTSTPAVDRPHRLAHQRADLGQAPNSSQRRPRRRIFPSPPASRPAAAAAVALTAQPERRPPGLSPFRIQAHNYQDDRSKASEVGSARGLYLLLLAAIPRRARRWSPRRFAIAIPAPHQSAPGAASGRGREPGATGGNRKIALRFAAPPGATCGGDATDRRSALETALLPSRDSVDRAGDGQ